MIARMDKNRSSGRGVVVPIRQRKTALPQGTTVANYAPGDRAPRVQRTPANEAFYVLFQLSAMFYQLMPGFEDGTFAGKVVPSMFNQPGYESGDKYVEALQANIEEAAPLAGLFLFYVASGYSVDAIKAAKAGQSEVAWSLVADARYYQGLIYEDLLSRNDGRQSVSANARKAAAASHQETYAMRDEVFAWCKVNCPAGKSAEAAGRELVKIVPISQRTAAEWVRLWRATQS